MWRSGRQESRLLKSPTVFRDHLWLPSTTSPTCASSTFRFTSQPLATVLHAHIHFLVSAYTSRKFSSFSPTLTPLLVAAVEACVYHAPATDCVILYVSNIDFAGHGFAPSPWQLSRGLFIQCHRWYANLATSSGRYTRSLGTALLARERLIFSCQLE